MRLHLESLDADFDDASRLELVHKIDLCMRVLKTSTYFWITTEKAYQLKINNIDMYDIRYETFDNNLDASKERAERYFDSATVTTPQELMAYFKVQ